MAGEMRHPSGYRWRSSQWFIIVCIAMALFAENFLYSYIVPILQVMLEDRLHVDKSNTQAVTSLTLAINAFVSMLAGPLVGYLADKMPNRKRSLLLSLGAEMVGTVVIMLSTSVPLLLVGRAVQAIGGNAVWIIGLATISETVGRDKTGRTLGAMSSFYASGLLFGPMVSGILLRLAGYWITWSFAMVVLGIDMVMRLVMIENKQSCNASKVANTIADKPSDDLETTLRNPQDDIDEQTPLLQASLSEEEHQTTAKSQSRVTTTSLATHSSDSSRSSDNFYKFIFTNPRALTALACHISMGIILLSLDTTLPLHASRTFGWNTAQVSLMFLALQLPSLFLAAILGMLKDKYGTRIFTGVGFIITAVCFWLLGAAANDGPAFTGSGTQAQVVTMVALTGIGIARTLVSGTALLEITNVMKDAEDEQPHRFGPNGKMSSAYSLTNFAWNVGMFSGPIISGSLTRTVGYYYMNVVVAAIIFMVSVLSFTFLGKKKFIRASSASS